MSGRDEMPKNVRDKCEADKRFKKLIESLRGKPYDWQIIDDIDINLFQNSIRYDMENRVMVVTEIYGLLNEGKSRLGLKNVREMQRNEWKRRNTGEDEADITYVP